MTVTFRCPSCRQKYTAPDSAAGKATRCRKCSTHITVPAPDEDWTTLQTPDSSDASTPWGDDLTLEPLEPTTAPLSNEIDTTGLQHRPSGRRKSRVTSGQPNHRSGAAVALVVVGIVLLIIGNRERRLAALAKSTPQSISVSQLVANGPGDNIYLDLTDVHMLLDQAVIKTKGSGLRKSNWEYAWIPVVPASDFGTPNPIGVKVIVGTKRCSNEARLAGFAQLSSLRGIIVNETDKLNAEERKLLGEGLPGVDIGSCYIFREGQGPGYAWVRMLLLGGGAITLLVGLALGVYQVRGFVLARL